MKRTVFLFLAIFLCASFGALPLAGCKGPDNSAEVEKLKTPAPSNNPDVPKPSENDMTMTDDPKTMKGKGPGSGGGP